MGNRGPTAHRSRGPFFSIADSGPYGWRPSGNSRHAAVLARGPAAFGLFSSPPHRGLEFGKTDRCGTGLPGGSAVDGKTTASGASTRQHPMEKVPLGYRVGRGRYQPELSFLTDKVVEDLRLGQRRAGPRADSLVPALEEHIRSVQPTCARSTCSRNPFCGAIRARRTLAFRGLMKKPPGRPVLHQPCVPS